MKDFNNLREIIENSAKEYGQRIAFKIKNKGKKGDEKYRDVTYSIMNEEMKHLGSFIIRSGLKGKRIAVIGKNCYEWMLVYYSTLATDSVIVPLDSGLFSEEINEQLDRAEVDAIFYTEMFEEALAHRKDLLKIRMDSEEFKEIASDFEICDEYNSIEIDKDKMSILLFTSGTTSKSKAVMLSQKNIASNVYAMTIWEDLRKEDVNMAILPFHHTFGMTQIALFLACGMCNVFCEGLRIAKCLKEYRVSVLVGVPRIVDEMYLAVTKLIKKENKEGKVKFGMALTSALRKVKIDIRRKVFSEIIEGLGGGLRLIIVGAAAAKPEVLKWFNDVGVLTIQGYGLTESSPVISAENEDNMRLGSIGKALPGIEVKIVDKDENGMGEIIAKGENIMLGYYKYDGESPIKDGWLHTGDIGYIDKDGFIFITGRKKNVIVLNNGKNVFPEELEMLLSNCDVIKECIVVHKTDEGKDLIHAKVVYREEVGKEEAERKVGAYIEELNKKLISYKQIKSFELTDKEMEKTTTLKIKR